MTHSASSPGDPPPQAAAAVPALLGGAAARRVVADRRGGRVVAVFPRSIYIAGAAGGLACIGPVSLGAGPLNLLCALPDGLDWQARGLPPDAAVASDGRVLEIPGFLQARLAGLRRWRPPAPPPRDDAIVAANLARLAALPRIAAAGDGLAPLIAPLARGDRAAAPLRPLVRPAAPLLRLAWPAARALAEWAAAAADDVPTAPVEQLLGLGPGLTPSGDDLLGGCLVALHALGDGAAARRLGARVMALAPGRTGAISAAHLACAAAGEGSAALHAFIIGLMSPQAAGLGAAIAELAAVGHSSGCDMMAGAVLACAARVGRLSA